MEADHGEWVNLDDLVDKLESDQIKMLPPTKANCLAIQGLTTSDLAEASANSDMNPIMPTLVQIDGRWYIDSAGAGE